MCYPPWEEIEADDAFLSDEQLAKTGYRLLTEDEWECVCRAGSRTPWFCGNDPSHLPQFGWFIRNSDRHLHAVGTLLPNPWGLFDMAGNVTEWCHPADARREFVLKGGSFQNQGHQLRSARRYSQSINGYSFIGFRVACTIASEP